VSIQDDSPDQSKSLLRRLLDQDQEVRVPDEDMPPPQMEALPSDAVKSPIPGHTPPDSPSRTAPASPIRPTIADDSQPQEHLTPSLPEKPSLEELTPREQMQRAEEALSNLRAKMAQVAAEFAQGKLNQAQFHAIYSRYSEQRDITERLLARNPESKAWQLVVQPGHTTFLKKHFEARVLSYAIYDQDTFETITITGPIQLEHTQLSAALGRLKAIIEERGDPGPAHKKLSDGRCVLFVPGTMSTAVVIFSLEPSVAQVERVQDIHRDFERANQHALQTRNYAAERLVFPHRALFEEKKL
jgi:hypothetical protein